MSLRSKSYEVLPALSVRGPELRRSLRTVTIAWMYGMVWMSCIMGSHVTIFSRMLGFTNFDFGLMTALPFLARFAHLPAVILTERTGLRKYQFLVALTIHRLSWLLIALIPLVMPIPSRLAVYTMLLLLTLSWSLAAFGMPGWMTWMGDLIPRRIRGRYLALRARVARVAQIAVVIALGVLLDQVTAHGSRAAVLWTISGIFTVAAIFGTIDILLFRGIREVFPTTAELPRTPGVQIRVRRARGRGPIAWTGYAGRYVAEVLREFLVRPMKDRSFRYYVGYGATMAAAMSVAGWFFWLHCLEYLHLSKLAVNVLYLVVAPLAAIASAGVWGRLIDRWGRRPTLLLATTCVVFSVMPYFAALPTTGAPAFVAGAVNWVSSGIGRLVGGGDWQWLGPEAPVGAWLWIALSCVIGGVGWSGIFLAQMGIMMGFADGPGRDKYVAGSAVLIGLGGVLGGYIGGQVAQSLQFLRDAPIVAGPIVLNNLHATFALSMLARLGGLAWLVGMPDPGAGRVRDLVRRMRMSLYTSIVPRLSYPLRMLGWMRGNRRGRRDDR